jgi:hypothetical protein
VEYELTIEKTWKNTTTTWEYTIKTLGTCTRNRKLTIKTYGKRHNKLGITTNIHELPQPSKQREIDY